MKQNRVKNLVLKGWLAAALLASGAASAAELLNSSYDVSRELFVALNPGFEQQWNQQHPNDKLTIKQSHAGSSKQALAILQGLRADVVTYNQVTDVQILHDRGQLIPADWQSRLPNNSSPFYSTMAFLVRKDNPKGIHTWNDLVRDDVKLVFPNPKTSGNGRYTYLAAWGAASQADGNDAAKTRAFMTRFLKNVLVFDTGGRGATTTFVERGLGDVLISFESEVNNIRKQYGEDKYEVIVPPVPACRRSTGSAAAWRSAPRASASSTPARRCRKAPSTTGWTATTVCAAAWRPTTARSSLTTRRCPATR